MIVCQRVKQDSEAPHLDGLVVFQTTIQQVPERLKEAKVLGRCNAEIKEIRECGPAVRDL